MDRLVYMMPDPWVQVAVALGVSLMIAEFLGRHAHRWAPSLVVLPILCGLITGIILANTLWVVPLREAVIYNSFSIIWLNHTVQDARLAAIGWGVFAAGLSFVIALRHTDWWQMRGRWRHGG